jgi:hypothetical protein
MSTEATIKVEVVAQALRMTGNDFAIAFADFTAKQQDRFPGQLT